MAYYITFGCINMKCVKSVKLFFFFRSFEDWCLNIIRLNRKNVIWENINEMCSWFRFDYRKWKGENTLNKLWRRCISSSYQVPRILISFTMGIYVWVTQLKMGGWIYRQITIYHINIRQPTSNININSGWNRLTECCR